jgi:hypothetical protein
MTMEAIPMSTRLEPHQTPRGTASRMAGTNSRDHCCQRRSRVSMVIAVIKEMAA